jgi:hypothetical protein
VEQILVEQWEAQELRSSQQVVSWAPKELGRYVMIVLRKELVEEVEEADMVWTQLVMPVGEDIVAVEEALEDIVAYGEAVAIAHMQDIEHTVEEWVHYGIEVVVEDSSSRCMVAYSCCTSAEDTADVVDDAGVDYTASSCLHLVACLLALPADDGRSSCRLGCMFSFNPIACCVKLEDARL